MRGWDIGENIIGVRIEKGRSHADVGNCIDNSERKVKSRDDLSLSF
jgi:hypothetical protein